MFQNPNGERHVMYLSIVGPGPSAPSNSCSYTSPTRQPVTTGGEGEILATITAPSGAFTVTPVTVTDADGTRYIFNTPNKEAGVNGFSAELPDLVEDRNGNEIAVTDSGGGRLSLADTVGRTLLASSGFGAGGNTVQLSGQGAAYTLDWGTATSDFSVTANLEGGTCTVPTTISGSQPVVTSITLPNGSAFTFAYDPTYGLLQKVTFPNGGYIRYAWGLNSQSEEGTFDAASGTCSVRYDQPVLTDRYVSLDGSTEILHQHFAYATTWGSGSAWSSKQTTLTNSDLLRNTSFQTVYTYSGYAVPPQPNDNTASTLQIPDEQNIVYDDFSGATLRTVAESWQNPRLQLSKTITENNGQVSEQTFSYDQNEQQIQKDEYAYGNGAVGGLTRLTVHAYGCASGPHLVDRPTATKIEDNNGNVVAETDYFYDQSALTPSGATDGRDPAYAAGGGITARCNLTTLTKINSPNDISDTYTHDDAGNPLTHTDGNGNTTGYAYGSTYQAAYVTQTTLPSTSTGGQPVAHSETMTYDLAAGEIASQTDVQNQTTTDWAYDDPLSRLTEVDYADGGQTLYVFAAGNVETERKQHSDCNCYMHAFEDWDGLGRVIRSTAYNGSYWQTVDAARDGEGQPIYQSYAYFNSSATSPQATSNADQPGDTSTFDALGRVTLVMHSDNSQVTTSYSGPDATTVDEVGNKTMDIDDALGRLIEVSEYYNPTSYYSTYYGYGLLDDLTSVSQGSETRTYKFDNINRMLSAVNPESGTTTYLYDNDSNLTQKREANGTTITYSYDQLNRLRARSYSVTSPTAATPSVQIDYDVDSTGATTTDAYGRMTRVIAGSTSVGMDTYDPMGRLETEAETIPGGTYTTSIAYDAIGAWIRKPIPMAAPWILPSMPTTGRIRPWTRRAAMFSSMAAPIIQTTCRGMKQSATA
ncbi:MAG: hypothetical protein ACRD17_00945 [Terriglobales bacterium]